MSEHPPDRLWSGIDIVKLVAGTLGTVSAAIIGSFLGVAGTVTGAVVASLIGGLGTELYQKSLHRGVSKLREIQVQAPVAAPAAVGTPSVAAASDEEETPGHFDPVPQAGAKRRPRWKLIAIPAVAFFVLAMGAITLVEGVAGESFAAMFGKASAGSTTFSSGVREITGNADEYRQNHPATGTSKAPQKPGTDPTATTGPAPDATGTTPADGATAPTQTGAPEPTGGTQPGNTGTDTGGQNDQSTGDQGGAGDQPNADTQGGGGGERGPTGQQAPESP